MAKSGSRSRSAPSAARARQGPTLALFEGDGYHRALALLGLGRPGAAWTAARTAVLVALTWGVLWLLSWRAGSLLGPEPRESFLLDLACWAQFLGFIPLSQVAEPFIDSKMRAAARHLDNLAEPGVVDELAARASRTARWWVGDLFALGFGFCFTWLWTLDEAVNNRQTWHSVFVCPEPAAADPGTEAFAWPLSVACPEIPIAGGGAVLFAPESLNAAGVWASFVALPLFTYLWLRWVWKIGVWTTFLFRVSRQRLRLVATHPDRTGGLGCLSEVQTSFAVILFGTGVLFSTAITYKVLFEGTPLSSYTVWIPIVGYVLLAPGVFLAPLFLFTRLLVETRTNALLQYSTMATAIAERFERQWLRAGKPAGDGLFEDEAPSVVADFQVAFDTVHRMRVVPFDLRSLTELVTSSGAPFAPLLFLARLPNQVRTVWEVLVGGA